jgi:predicted ATPase
LTGGSARLVTLVGAGGIGKTRLAIAVGSGLIATFDGVVVVALDEVSSADLVVSSIALSLGVPESPGQSLLDLVINYLRPRKMLLIIDNFEHMVAGRRSAWAAHHGDGPGDAARHQSRAVAPLR